MLCIVTVLGVRILYCDGGTCNILYCGSVTCKCIVL